MIKTTKMHRVAAYNHFGVLETLFSRGPRLYISIIDHRPTDMRLDGIYDQLGVYQIKKAYAEKWAAVRGLSI